MSGESDTQARARRLLVQRLESWQGAGVLDIARTPPPVTPAPLAEQKITSAASSAAGTLQTPVVPQTPSSVPQEASMARLRPASAPSTGSAIAQPYPSGLPTAASGCQSLMDELNTQVRSCMLCRDLARTRKQTVFGVGNPHPQVVFFGEAPGADEDRQGEPFVGRAGQLLTKIIQACGWQRDDVYIMNVLKCRPPENRNPSPQETENCRPFFERQF